LNPAPHSARIRAFSLGALAILYCLLVLAPGLGGGFVFDDYPTIVEEKRIQLERLTWDGMVSAAFAFHPAGGLPRPLASASLALNALATDGLDPFGFKLTNLVIHVLNALLLFAWLRRLLLATGRSVERSALAAGGLALFWAIHPLQVSTVLYVVQRMEMLWVTFAFLSLLAYTHARMAQIAGRGGSLPALTLSMLAFVLGFTAKESAALIPFLIVALERIVFQCEARDPRWARFWRLASASGVAVGVLAVAGLFVKVIGNPVAYAHRDFDLAGRLLAQLEIVPRYLGLIVLPRIDEMTFYYDELLVPSGFEAGVIAGAALLISIVGLAWWQRRRRPLVAFGIALFLLGHLLTSGPLPLELVFEHRNYLPIAGVLLAIYGLLPDRLATTPARQIVVAIAIGALGLGSLTAIRAAAWGNPVVLAQSLVDNNPGSTRAAMDLGEQYMLAAGKDPASSWYPLAIAEFERASRLPQGSIMGEHALVLMHGQLGLPADPTWWPRLEQKLLSKPLRPQDIEALLGLVEHYLGGVPIDGEELGRVTLAVAKRQALSPDLLATFGQAAYQATGVDGPAAELFAMALASPSTDDEYRARVRRGISNIGGPELLAKVDATTPKALEPSP
jgi:hypothetical protein